MALLRAQQCFNGFSSYEFRAPPRPASIWNQWKLSELLFTAYIFRILNVYEIVPLLLTISIRIRIKTEINLPSIGMAR